MNVYTRTSQELQSARVLEMDERRWKARKPQDHQQHEQKDQLYSQPKIQSRQDSSHF